MIKAVLLFILGLILLVKGGDWFVQGAAGIAQKFHIPELLIGATVVSIGTTLPEVMVSATSALGGHGEIAYGNAIGSIICNTALIAALTAAVRPSKINKKEFQIPIAFFYVAAIFYVVNAYVFRSFSRLSGIVLLIIFVIYIGITVWQVMKHPEDAVVEEVEEQEMSMPMLVLCLVGGAALITIGANLLVDNGTYIAAALGVPEAVIALTFVALGTSLPELVTAITSLVKGHGALSLGNVVGANLFNLVLVSGVSITLNPFSIPQGKMIHGMNASLVMDIPVMFLVMSFLTIPALIRGKITRFQGVLLLLVYFAFCIAQFVL